MDYKIYEADKLPPSIYYIPEFLSRDEESQLIDKVARTPLTKWTQLRNRRLQNWGGIPHQKGMIPEQMPDWLNTVIQKVVSKGGGAFGKVKPNHVLLNEYLPGQGISPHLDGDLFYPTIATVSLGSHTVLNYYRPIGDDSSDIQLSDRLAFSILLQPRSLLLVKDAMYTGYLHGIDDILKDEVTEQLILLDNVPMEQGQVLTRSTRVSLTIRHVPNVAKFKLKF